MRMRMTEVGKLCAVILQMRRELGRIEPTPEWLAFLLRQACKHEFVR
jgi:hypothetical protein